MNATSIPLSAYIHIPWCVKKCLYCDFNSHTQQDSDNETAYIAALARDLAETRQHHSQRELHSIFFGGGTPSLFSGKAITAILNLLKQHYNVTEATEITLEANPGTTDQQKFRDYFAAGVNRLSIGVQTFDNETLHRLGRIHNDDEARAAAQAARQAGFDNFNLDMMYGLPDQTLAMAKTDLLRAIDLAPTHLSYYQLTIEPNTYFHRYPPPIPDDELAWDMHLQGIDILAEAGYLQYEVSAYAQPDRQCQHNLNYWEFGDYIGIGAGAHGKVSTEAGIQRYWKEKHPQKYLNTDNPTRALEPTIDYADRLFELLMNGLRLNAGIALDYALHRAQIGRCALHNSLQSYIDDNLIEISDTHLYPTPKGHLHLNSILSQLIAD